MLKANELDLKTAYDFIDEADEVNDGLFSIAGQSTLVEITHYGEKSADVFLIEVFGSAVGSTIYNSSEQLPVGDSLRSSFPVAVLCEAYTERDSAYARYFELLEQHNRRCF